MTLSNKLNRHTMLRFALLTVVMVALLSACQTEALTVPTYIAPQPTPEAASGAGHYVDFSHNGLEIRIPRPAGWESFTTDYGVVVAEKFGSVADQGTLQGLMSYVFVSPLSDYPQVVDADGNLTQQILDQIVSDASYVGSATVSETYPLEWDGHDAAYYLLSDSQANLRTLVIGMAVPERGMLVICTLSAPTEHSANVRLHLSDVLGGITINHATISAEVLASLPDPLEFPVDLP